MEEYARPLKPQASKRRPLLGITILLIEDSRYCSEAVRLMAMRSGARLRRADSLQAARRHLSIYRPDVVLVDLGLPDGCGTEIITELRQSTAPSPGIVVLSGNDGGPERNEAVAAGADCFLAKPLQDITRFQDVIKRLTTADGKVGGFVPQMVGHPLKLSHRAFLDDIGQMQRQLKRALPSNDRRKLRYLAQFVRSVAQTAQDRELMDKAAAFSVRLKGDQKWQSVGEKVLDLLENRLAGAGSI